MMPIGSVDVSSLIRNPERLLGTKGGAAADAASLTQGLGASAGAAATSTTAAQPVSFSKILGNAVQEVNSKVNAAETAKGQLLSGETGNVHQAMIAVQESSVAFSLMVEVRNKLVDSYQELMRMQV
jgi:flagellar hook-basal body complex protein FliE